MKELLNQIGSFLKSGQPKEVIAGNLLHATLGHFQSETGTLHLLDTKKNLLFLVAQLGLPENMINAVRVIPVGKGIAGQTVARNQPVTMCNLQANTSGIAQPSARQSGIGGMMCVPLRHNGTIVGTIGVGTVRPYEYTAEEIKILENIGRLVGDNLSLKRLAGEQATASAPAKPSSTVANGVGELMEAANVAWRRREFQKSIDLMEHAHKLAPDDPRILLGLGRHYGIRTDYERAEKYFEKAIRVMGWKTLAFVAAGEHSAFFRRNDMARRYYERALKQNGDTPEALCALAEVEERENHLDAALELVARAGHLNGNSDAATLIKARLHRLAGKKAEAESSLRQLLAKSDSNPQARSNAWYELGKILDGAGHYDEAMKSFLAAKDLILPSAAPEIQAQQAVQARLKKAGGRYTSEMLRNWFDARGAFQPPQRLALLGGHPRSGTTLLEQVLDAHPDVISSEETMLFEDEILNPLIRNLDENNLPEILNSSTPARFASWRTNYLRLTERRLGEAIGGRMLIDKNPSLTALIPCVARAFPESKFLIALRDPRDVCLSCFTQSMELNPITSTWLTLENTVTEYASLMNFWLTIKPNLANPWLEVRYEDLVNDLESTARRTLEFLEIPWDANVLGFDKHAQTKVVRSPTYADVKKPVYRGAVGRWRNYQKYLEPHLEKLEPFVKAFGYE